MALPFASTFSICRAFPRSRIWAILLVLTLITTYRLVNLAVSPGVRFKQSAMPFVQMENISHFLRACQSPPLNLRQHDTFLTVDLFEQKDPAQVLQCLGAFSRAANAANPTNFPSFIGPKIHPGALSPQDSGYTVPAGVRNRGASVTSNNSSGYGSGSKRVLSHQTGDSASGRRSPTKSPSNGPGSPGPVTSSWSRREHEGATAPAWNIAQYGYMGGASQGNLGISFGGRRQITSAGPLVPSMQEKDRLRREREAEEERLQQEAEERHRRERDAEERARLDEERRWEEQTRRLREEEHHKAEAERRQWEEQEYQWKLTEEKRRKEEKDAANRFEEERRHAKARNDDRLRGQFLSQYQAEQTEPKPKVVEPERNTHSDRIKELEKELEQAREREAEYEKERQGRPIVAEQPAKLRARSRSRPGEPTPVSPNPNAAQQNRQESWTRGEREFLQTKWHQNQQHQQGIEEDSEVNSAPPPKSPRPLPDPKFANKPKTPAPGARPLPVPPKHTSSPAPAPAPAAAPNRTDRFLSSTPAPLQLPVQKTYARELGATEERDGEDRRRVQSQEKTKAGGWASKSLLEREMEMERQRQKEWEESQMETAAAVRSGNGVDGIGGGMGGRWDVGQWSGYTGGDGQNRGTQGIGAGRRQIVGPRPLPGANR